MPSKPLQNSYPFPNRLRSARQNLNLRQLDVACKLGFCTTDRISRWEKGQGMPNVINLLKLAAIYQVPPQNLYPEIAEEISAVYASSHEGISQ